MLVEMEQEKLLEKWSNKDFVIYFSNKLKETTGRGLEIPPVAWQGFMGRMKGFRTKLRISNENYKEFIDGVFSDFFTKDDYIPAFGSIVSEKVYNIVGKLLSQKKNNPNFSNDDFIKLRNELYHNNLLFQKFKSVI